MEKKIATISVEFKEVEHGNVGVTVSSKAHIDLNELPDEIADVCFKTKRGIEELMNILFTDIAKVVERI